MRATGKKTYWRSPCVKSLRHFRLRDCLVSARGRRWRVAAPWKQARQVPTDLSRGRPTSAVLFITMLAKTRPSLRAAEVDRQSQSSRNSGINSL
jgi:hypothetical protein